MYPGSFMLSDRLMSIWKEVIVVSLKNLFANAVLTNFLI